MAVGDEKLNGIKRSETKATPTFCKRATGGNWEQRVAIEDYRKLHETVDKHQNQGEGDEKVEWRT